MGRPRLPGPPHLIGVQAAALHPMAPEGQHAVLQAHWEGPGHHQPRACPRATGSPSDAPSLGVGGRPDCRWPGWLSRGAGGPASLFCYQPRAPGPHHALQAGIFCTHPPSPTVRFTHPQSQWGSQRSALAPAWPWARPAG